jgi:hypothetical protein
MGYVYSSRDKSILTTDLWEKKAGDGRRGVR